MKMTLQSPVKKERKEDYPGQNIGKEYAEKLRKLEEQNPVIIKNDPYQNAKNLIDHLNRKVEHVRDQVHIPNYTRTPDPYQEPMIREKKVIKKKNTTFIYTVERPVRENVLHARRRIISLEILPNEEKTSQDTSTQNSMREKKKHSAKKGSEPSPTSKPVKSIRKQASTKTVKRKKVGIKASIPKTKPKPKVKIKAKLVDWGVYRKKPIRKTAKVTKKNKTIKKTKTRIPVIVDDFKDPKKTANKIDDFIKRALLARARRKTSGTHKQPSRRALWKKLTSKPQKIGLVPAKPRRNPFKKTKVKSGTHKTKIKKIKKQYNIKTKKRPTTKSNKRKTTKRNR